MRAGSATVSRAAAGQEPSASTAIAPLPSHLHVRIIGASAAFWGDPIDILGRVLDVACLAVDAILGVDLKPRFTAFTLDEFVNARRAVSLLWAVVDRQVDRRGYVGVLERQMNRLILLMI